MWSRNRKEFKLGLDQSCQSLIGLSTVMELKLAEGSIRQFLEETSCSPECWNRRNQENCANFHKKLNLQKPPNKSCQKPIEQALTTYWRAFPSENCYQSEMKYLPAKQHQAEKTVWQLFVEWECFRGSWWVGVRSILRMPDVLYENIKANGILTEYG